jgi:hypothetical protein
MNVPRLTLETIAFFALASALITSSTAAPTRTTSVYFLRGEQLASVPRQASNAAGAIRARCLRSRV